MKYDKTDLTSIIIAITAAPQMHILSAEGLTELNT